MPSIEQCDATAGIAALPSTLEIFDTFKPVTENGKDSDSEESFHLPLDEDDIENQSVVSNGRDKEIITEETEDDILNKFETADSKTPDHLDPHIEDSILNVDEEDQNVVIKEDKPSNSSKIQVKITYNFQEYEDSGDGEFKSLYETDPELTDAFKTPEELKSEKLSENEETMEVNEGTNGANQNVPCPETVELKEEKSGDSMDFEDDGEPEQEATNKNIDNIHLQVDTPMEDSTESTKDAEESEIMDDVEMTEKPQITNQEHRENLNQEGQVTKETFQGCAQDEGTVSKICAGKTEVQVSLNNKSGVSTEEKNYQTGEKAENIPKLSDEATENENHTTLENEVTADNVSDILEVLEEGQVEENKTENKASEEDLFKVPVELPTKQAEERRSGPDLSNETSNDKTDDEDVDLLDVSMIRETEEDDACAIADAIEDSEANKANEKSDEEQSEKMETEQENSDADKDQESNDDAIGFDDMDDDSRMDGDDSSNAESTMKSKEKFIEISESSSSVSDMDAIKQLEKSSVVSEEVKGSEESNNLDHIVDDTNCSEVDKEDISESAAKDQIGSSDTTKTEKVDEAKESDVNEVNEAAVSTDSMTEDDYDRHRTSLNKRTYSGTDIEDSEVFAKKPKLATEFKDTDDVSDKHDEHITTEKEKSDETPFAFDKIKTLTSFAKFMQCRKLTAKLSRSDLEQFCIQKICESLMLKSSEGDLHQTIKKQDRTIENLRKDLQQLTKQCKDLEIVNKKLMNELRNQNGIKKPLVPLKITRSVGLQVRLNPANESANQNRRRPPLSTTPQKQTINSPTSTSANRSKVGTALQSTAVRQVMQTSPQKSPLATGQTTTGNSVLNQALQKRPVIAKRTTPISRKSTEAAKPGNPGVIDLTDEDDRLAQAKTVSSSLKVIGKNVSPATNKSLPANKVGVVSQGKPVAVQKGVSMGPNKGNLSQAIRLTPTSVITSSANGSPQMVYVVPTITSNAGGQQKVAFVNFQPTNGVISGTLNGSPVSVMSNKQQMLTVKTVPSPLRHKHPAPLPTTPRINLDPKLKPLLPKPLLTIKKIETGIILQWKMPYKLDMFESIASYQLYAYQETSAPPSTDMWRKVGDVKALALPMACTLTQFADKNKYYFAVRSVDVHKRIGAFSDPEEISL